MGSEKRQSLTSKFMQNCIAAKIHFCPLPSALLAMQNKRLAPYFRIFIAIWLRTAAKPKSLGVWEIEISQRVIAGESGTSASDVSRFIAAAHECGLVIFRKGWPSMLTICKAMLAPVTLLDFFRAVDFILESEAETCEVGAGDFGAAVRMRMANPTEEPEPERSTSHDDAPAHRSHIAR